MVRPESSLWRRFGEKVRPFLRPALQHKSAPALVVDMVMHMVTIGTSPADYLRYEFYKGDRTAEQKCRYLSKRGSRYFPWSKNPVAQLALFDDKQLFKTILKGCDIPQPALLATIGRRYEIRTGTGFAAFLKSAARDLVIKPVRGSGGAGIRMLEYRNGGYTEPRGRADAPDAPLEPAVLWQQLVPMLDLGYVVEARLRNAPGIAAFNPDCLNTFRIVTIRTDDGEWRVSLVALRIGATRSAVDNLAAGGTVLKFSPDGVGVAAYDWTERCEIETHAGTGKALVGFRLEEYASLCGFALGCCAAFPGMGAIGWDIALTGDGPQVVEANPFFDSWYFQMGACGPLLTEDIASRLTPRRPFSRWDRRFVSPRMKRHRILA